MDYQEHHRTACLNKQKGYLDPDTNLFVMTEWFLRSRGKCCGNGCRHCPFGRSITGGFSETVQLYNVHTATANWETYTALFWSGGKDSYLAYRTLVDQGHNIVLVTTFSNGMVGHQEIPVETIVRQAKALNTPLVLIPLSSNTRYEVTVIEALQEYCLTSLAFGDLHLEGIRQWRVENFQAFQLIFPVWKVSYKELAAELFASEPTIRISALGDMHPSETGIKVGDVYTPEMIHVLDVHGLDTFGEHGEFHTVVEFW
jgi:diphthamide synthase (EF-2-diphthine--ammonia ligase)